MEKIGVNRDSQSVVGHQKSAARNTGFLDTLSDCGMEQMVTFPTRMSSTPDLFLSNRQSLVEKCKALPGLGDNDIVFVESSITPKRSNL